MGLTANKQKITRSYFTGMNSYDAPREIGDTECANIENALISRAGLIVKRNGLTELGTHVASSTACLGLGKLESLSVALLFRVERTNLYWLDGTTWTSIKSDLTNALTTSFAQLNSLMFLSNGTDNVFSVNTSKAVTDEGNTNADPPKGTIMEAHDNRLFIAGVSGANEDIVYFSDVADGQTFDRAVNLFKVDKGTKGKITALVSLKNKQLAIFKEDAIFTLNTNGANPLNDWELKLFNPKIGCPAGRTAVNVGNDAMFLAKDGIRILSRSEFDTIQAGVISRTIQDLVEDINWNAITTSHAEYFENRYILMVPTGSATTPSTTFVWDALATGEAAKRGIGINSWVQIPQGTWNLSDMIVSRYNTQPELISGHASDGDIHKTFSGTTDDAELITMTVRFKREVFGDRDLDKHFSHIFAQQDGTDNVPINFYYSVDFGSDTATEPASINSAGTIPVLPIDLPFNLDDDVLVSDELYINHRAKDILISMQATQTGAQVFRGYTLYGRSIPNQTQA